MSCQPFPSPASVVRSHKSKYTYQHLLQLAICAANSPLRVIAHVDLDAFYAQCEMVRLDLPETQPLAVQQWQGLIAVNYPARKFGLNRHITITEAKKLCPDLIAQHVATWREGDEKWAYHDGAFKDMASHKVALDPYRLESRRILATIKESLPENLQIVEKASIDEVFLDLSAQVHSIMVQRYPELTEPPPYDDPTEFLPPPPTTALDWRADALVDLDEGETEFDDPDWDDIAILIGSEIVRSVRANILTKLKYTCSAGIARNKMLAKLGSAHRKPNQQTVIRHRATSHFLSKFKFTQIRGFGGKLGEQINSAFETDMVSTLLSISLEQLKLKLGDETGAWVYQIMRGNDFSEVSARTQIKSMLSAKSFRPHISSWEQGTRWLRIFSADIYSRLVEESVLENKRRPKTIHLYHRQGTQTKSRSSTIPLGKKITEMGIFEMAKSLLSQIIRDGQAWPCANLSLSVGGFEDGIKDNMGIGAFLIRGDEASSTSIGDLDSCHSSLNRPSKRPRIEKSKGIEKFFHQNKEHRNEGTFSSERSKVLSPSMPVHDPLIGTEDYTSTPKGEPHSEPSADLKCTQCHKNFSTAEIFQSHQDWHLAMNLQDRENMMSQPNNRSAPSVHKRVSTQLGKNKKSLGTTSKGQSKLKFG
ncbi:hypothetical protein K3495_g1228 [Podosphaera aphanis]|nr:hypothetical protein K3495_g1228 [Podosphaera aphanis]